MNIICWLFGHKRLWPTLIGMDVNTVFMEYVQRNPDSGEQRGIRIHPCERCHGLYWEDSHLPPKLPPEKAE